MTRLLRWKAVQWFCSYHRNVNKVCLIQTVFSGIKIPIDITIKEEIIMPKMKTKRAAAKRFKTTGTGKLMKMKAYKSHILNKKSTKRKRNLRKAVEVDATNSKMMKRMLPYSK